MFKAINGWTKKKILKVLEARRYNCAAESEVTGACMYTTSNGNRCAVGMFIPKRHEGGSLQGPVSELLELYPDLTKHMPLPLDGLTQLQSVHDGESYAQTGERGRNAKKAMIDWVKKNVK